MYVQICEWQYGLINNQVIFNLSQVCKKEQKRNNFTTITRYFFNVGYLHSAIVNYTSQAAKKLQKFYEIEMLLTAELSSVNSTVTGVVLVVSTPIRVRATLIKRLYVKSYQFKSQNCHLHQLSPPPTPHPPTHIHTPTNTGR